MKNPLKNWISLIWGFDSNSLPIPPIKVEHKETGKENADKFVDYVKDQSIYQRKIVIVYGSKWIWMRNAEWRSYVVQMLMPWDSPFERVDFSQSNDEEDEWTFRGYLKQDSRIENLSLHDSIPGEQ